MEPETVVDYRTHVGEGPLWHPDQQRLYWIDIPTGRLFWYEPATGRHEQFYSADMVGGLTFQTDGTLLLFMAGGAVAVLRGGELDYIVDGIPGEEENRFNDVIADPAGRVFCGTMPLDRERVDERLGTLYRLDTDGSLTPLVDGVGISNGLGFSPDHRHMYYTDTITRRIDVFDYDVHSGSISKRRVFTETGEGRPDGMTVDADGYVWSAIVGGWRIVRYTPQGEEERAVRFSAKYVTSLAFGGPGLTDIYVTTMGTDERPDAGPGGGALHRLSLGIKGLREHYSRVGL